MIYFFLDFAGMGGGVGFFKHNIFVIFSGADSFDGLYPDFIDFNGIISDSVTSFR